MSHPAAGSARRLERYTVTSVYGVLAVQPLVFVGAFPAWGPYAGVLVGLGLAAVSILACRWVLRVLRDGRRLRGAEWAGLAVWLLLAVALVVVMAVQARSDGVWAPAVVTAVAVPVGTAALLLPARAGALAGLLLGAAAGAGVARQVHDTAAAVVAATVVCAGATAVIVLSFWLTAWMLRNIWELEEARRTAAQLAIAEERLRIARDLHDLFGRTLATVAVKTELAGELVRRGRSDAALDQLAEVRGLADQTGQQVRAVVQGYRDDDLAVELRGAGSLLESAGIRCLVRGTPPAGLDPAVVSALVWVLREAVTNVIRHAAAQECLITLEPGPPVRMVITNDGVAADRPAAAESGGHGLRGMRERLGAVGGQLSVHRHGDRHTVEVVVPVAVEAAR